MEAFCVRHTDLPGTSKLFSDLVYHYDRVSKFYLSSPYDFDSYLTAARKIDYPESRRAAMVEALREINANHPLLGVLARPGAVAVVTGQQVGLYGGPCYTFFKALTAVSLARQLSAAGQSAVPVFWLATEDHDFEEIDHAWVYEAPMRPAQLRSTGSARPQQTVGSIEIGSVSSDLPALLAGFPHGAEIAAAVAKAYVPGRTYGQAFRDLVKEFLGSHEVLFLDPLSPKIREIAAPFLADAASKSAELSAAVYARSQELVAAGYHAQVHLETKESPLFFQLDNGRRMPVKGSPSAVRPEQLSPNALLRPVMQDFLLPTAVMIGGPAEVAYLAQSAVLYQRLLERQPAIIPRAAFTLLDSRAGKLMDRYKLDLADILHPEQAFQQLIAERLVPPAINAAFDKAAQQTHSALDGLRNAMESHAFDPTLVASMSKSRAKIEYQLTKSRGKLAREIMRREQRAFDDAAYLQNLIYPRKHLQERFYSMLPFLAQHGPGLIGRIYENIHVNCPDHHVLPL